MNENEEDNRYIIEYISVGSSVKVTAFDPLTLTEAIVIAPASLSQREMGELAVRKLHYLLDKKKL